MSCIRLVAMGFIVLTVHSGLAQIAQPQPLCFTLDLSNAAPELIQTLTPGRSAALTSNMAQHLTRQLAIWNVVPQANFPQLTLGLESATPSSDAEVLGVLRRAINATGPTPILLSFTVYKPLALQRDLGNLATLTRNIHQSFKFEIDRNLESLRDGIRFAPIAKDYQDVLKPHDAILPFPWARFAQFSTSTFRTEFATPNGLVEVWSHGTGSAIRVKNNDFVLIQHDAWKQPAKAKQDLGPNEDLTAFRNGLIFWTTLTNNRSLTPPLY
jgi:hypothetical protein